MTVHADVAVNEAFRSQRITGQQRYATEVVDRLALDQASTRLVPRGRWARHGLLTWAWVLTVLPWLARRRVLVSLTSRAPVWHPRHVLVVHDLFVLTNPEWYSRLYIWTHAPLLRLQLRSARQIVAVSEPVAEQVTAYTAATVRVAPNAPSDAFSRGPVDVDLLGARGLEAGGYLLAVGSLDPRKNFSGLASAYSQLSPTERETLPLVVVGGSASIFADTTISWPAGVVSTGYVDDEELVHLYRGAAGVVFPSFAEGFGLPVVEAAMVGAPLIVSDLPVFRWILADGPAAYVAPGDPSDIARALRLVLDRAVRGFDTAEAGRLARRFSWEDSASAVAAAARDAGSGS